MCEKFILMKVLFLKLCFFLAGSQTYRFSTSAIANHFEV